MNRTLLSNALLVIAIGLLVLNLIVSLIQSSSSSYAAGTIQYKLVQDPIQSDWERTLNRYGKEGWELIQIHGGIFVFKK